jgi:CO/xanthine dehydrogenase Mo-binding subunit
MSTAVDCGRVLNPINARVQALGGIAQSIGMAMFEEVQYGQESNYILSRDLQSYKIPCQMDMPQLDIEFVESEEPTGPFGAKSLGEISTGTPAPAIADALFNALGIHFDSLPITPEKVLKAIRGKEAADADS